MLLRVLANLTGTTYETINVIIFCIFIPALIVFLLYIIHNQKSKIDFINHKLIDR